MIVIKIVFYKRCDDNKFRVDNLYKYLSLR